MPKYYTKKPEVALKLQSENWKFRHDVFFIYVACMSSGDFLI